LWDATESVPATASFALIDALPQAAAGGAKNKNMGRVLELVVVALLPVHQVVAMEAGPTRLRNTHPCQRAALLAWVTSCMSTRKP